MYTRCCNYDSLILYVSTLILNSVSPYFINPWQNDSKHSLKSFRENTMQGPEAKVSTSVHLFLILVKNCYTKLTLLTISKWLYLSTDENNVHAYYCYGWIRILICDYSVYSNVADSAACSL